MTVGKPNFNLNSFGVKYLSKDEVQEFLEKETKVYNYEPPIGQDQAALRAERAKKPKGTLQASESAKKLISEVKPAEATPKPKVTPDSKFTFNDDKYGVPRRGGSLKTPTHSAGRGESGYLKEKQPTQTNPERSGAGNAPSTLPKGSKTDMKVGRRKVTVGTGEKGKEEFDKKEGKGETWYASDSKQPHSEQGVKRQQKKDVKRKEIGLAESKVNELKRRRDIETLQSQKPEDRKTYDTIQNDETQGINYESTPTSTSSTDTTEANVPTESEASFKKRSEENERKRQADAAKKKKKKLTDNERMTNIVERYRAERVLGKSNDIITEMNIMKLDLMNKVRYDEYGDQDYSDDDHGVDYDSIVEDMQNQHETNQTEAQRMNFLKPSNPTKGVPTGLPKKLAKSADETIFKAISLKLDLMNKLDTSPKGMKGQKFVRGSMASAGRKPATKLPNAGGVQDKLEIMRDEAPEVTPEKQAKDKKLLETGATGKPSGSVANRYG